MTQGDELVRRVKAAAAFGGYSLTKLEKKVSFSRSTLYRRGKGEFPMESGKLYEIHEATGAPMWFLKGGWDGWQETLTPARLEALADELFPGDPPDS